MFSTLIRFGKVGRQQIGEARRQGRSVINPLILAEVASAYTVPSALERAVDPSVYAREDLSWEAAFAAGMACRAYRRAGGLKRSPLPDFYIGAHAEFRGYSLLTRDPARYRTYFPTLKIIAPDTHP